MEGINNLDNKKKQELFYLEKVLDLKKIKVSKIFPSDPLDFKIIADNKKNWRRGNRILQRH